jgi:transposase
VRQLGSSSTLLCRWSQAQLVAEGGRAEVARHSEVRALRARLERAEQQLDMLKSLHAIDSLSHDSALYLK